MKPLLDLMHVKFLVFELDEAMIITDILELSNLYHFWARWRPWLELMVELSVFELDEAMLGTNSLWIELLTILELDEAMVGADVELSVLEHDEPMFGINALWTD